MFLIVLTVAFFSPFYVRVYVCVRGHARAYMFGSGVSWHTPVVCRECGRCSFRVHIYCAGKSPSKMHHLYPLFLYLFYMFFPIQKELKVTAPRKVVLRW